MSLSPSSFEILTDLLAIRLESFLVTSAEETRELRQLRHCQNELRNLQQMAREMGFSKASMTPAQPGTKPRVSRRLQRLMDGLQQEQGRTASSF